MNKNLLVGVIASFLIAPIWSEEKEVIYEIVLEGVFNDNLNTLPKLDILPQDLESALQSKIPENRTDSNDVIIERLIEGALGEDLRSLPKLDVKPQDVGGPTKENQSREEMNFQADGLDPRISEQIQNASTRKDSEANTDEIAPERRSLFWPFFVAAIVIFGILFALVRVFSRS